MIIEIYKNNLEFKYKIGGKYRLSLQIFNTLTHILSVITINTKKIELSYLILYSTNTMSTIETYAIYTTKNNMIDPIKTIRLYNNFSGLHSDLSSILSSLGTDWYLNE